MADLNQQLEALVAVIQQHPVQAPARQIALGRLICLIQQSGKLYCPRGHLSIETFTYIYQEALQNLWIELCRNIDSYDPQKSSVMTWVNTLLKYRFIDAREKFYPDMKKTRNFYTADHDKLDKAVEREGSSLSEQVIQWLKEDPDQLFRKKQLKSCPRVNFQILALKRLENSWEELSEEYGVKIPTLSNFYRRACQEFAPKLKEYLEAYNQPI
jgi:DNA-directed RNA polymerase specialized sigma24 family protein